MKTGREKGIMKLCPYFDFSSDRVEFSLGLLLEPLNSCEFLTNVCCHKHTLRKDVNERPDFLRPLSIKFCGCPQKIIR